MNDPFMNCLRVKLLLNVFNGEIKIMEIKTRWRKYNEAPHFLTEAVVQKCSVKKDALKNFSKFTGNVQNSKFTCAKVFVKKETHYQPDK